jgi:polysaccharide biosynthesis/export protein
MKNCLFLVVLIVIIPAILVSCVTNKKLIYLQEAQLGETNYKILGDTINMNAPSIYKILPNDNIYVRVVTPDPQWANMFNALPTSSSMNISPESAQLLSYPVEVDGTIELPYIGKFHVEGKTLSEVKIELEAALKNFVSDAAVTVRLVNNYVSIIGEVRQPGRYPIYKDRLNIFEVLALAGDLSEFSNRRDVQVIRRSQGGNIIKKFSLLDRGIMTSEFFYVLPNDVIYAQPRKGKFFDMSTFPYSIVLSGITSFVLIYNFVKNLGK